jgi:adenylate cyclase
MTDARAERRLTAILACDVAGYSRLMGADEEGTLARLNAVRREFWEPKAAEYRGRIVKRTGDGVLIEFASVVDAARYGIEIQRGMAKRNADVPQDKRIELRMGIHVGDILIEYDDIFGDGVNVAARLESIAEPGGICLSRAAFEQVDGKLDVCFEDGGEQQLKNITRPVRVYRTKFGSAKASPRLTLPDKPSIAVLPFQNMSGNPDQDYFVDGIVEDIITGLSRIKWFFVIARNSTFTYKGRAIDVKQVGRELGVRYVLEGSVRKLADRVRVTAQLIDTSTGAHVWAERYDRNSDDIFALQDEITLSVIGAIEPSLRLAEIERAKRKRPDSLDAYDLVLQAIPDVYSRMPEPSKRALVLLERAITLEPNYALAHACAAECHHTLFLRGGMQPEDRAASARHAQIAITHGQDDALALALAGFSVGMDGHDRAAAFAAFEGALAVSPSSALTYILGSVILAYAGEPDRSIDWAERGLRLSPLDPWRSSALLSLSLANFHRRQYEEAVTSARKSVQASPAFSIPHVALTAALAKLGQLDEAKVAAARVLELTPTFRYKRFLASVNCEPAFAASLSQALGAAGLPE